MPRGGPGYSEGLLVFVMLSYLERTVISSAFRCSYRTRICRSRLVPAFGTFRFCAASSAAQRRATRVMSDPGTSCSLYASRLRM